MAVITVHEAGGGWYEIKRGDEVVEKVQGKAAAEARAAEMAGAPDGTPEGETVAVTLSRTVPATMLTPEGGTPDYRGRNRLKGETIDVAPDVAERLVKAGHATEA